MLKYTFCILMLCISFQSFAQIKLPDLSPRVEINQKIGLMTATLSYSRPSMRGRDLFGDKGVLAFGEKWRTGANATTKVTFSTDVELNGEQLSKGTYAVLSTPEEKSWTFHFYPYEKLAYTRFLHQSPVFEITVPTQQANHFVETLSIHFEAIKLDAASLVLEWANYKIAIPVKVNQHQSILANIDKTLNGPSGFDYFQAALYLHETHTDLPLALTYIQKATQAKDALFFQVYREALILKDMGRKLEAIEVAKRSILLSEKAGNTDFVRLSHQLIESFGKK